MNEPPPTTQERIIRAGELLEAAPYFLLGTAIACVAIVAAFLAALEAWRLGDRSSLCLLGLVAAAFMALFGWATYRNRPILALGCLLAVFGGAVYVWGSLGFALPSLAP